MDKLRTAIYSQHEMFQRGSGGHLSFGFERYILISKLDGLEPCPSNNESDDGEYHPGREITDPIEVVYSASDDTYIVYAGNHRIAQAKANGQSHILAFVQPDLSVSRSFIGTSPLQVNPDSHLKTPKKFKP